MSTPPVDLRSVLGAVTIQRDLVRVTGADATTFLQGQLSADLNAVPESHSTWAFLLEPTGRVTALLRATRHDDGWLLDVEEGFGAGVQERLARFLLRVAVELRLEEVVSMLAIRGPGASALASSGSSGSSGSRDGLESGPLALDAAWPGVEGIDLLALDASGDATPDLPTGVVATSEHDLDALRIGLGVPAMGAEITEATIPGELGAYWLDAAVSFTKGCYTGQELVARIDSRGGNVPRPVRRLETASVVQPGDDVLLAGEVAGQITSAVSHEVFGNGALAPLARRVEPGAPDVVVRCSAGDVAADVFATAEQ